MSISDNLKSLRKARGLTQIQLAEQADISRVTLGNYERGDRTPNAEVAARLAKALGVTVEQLMSRGYSRYEADGELSTVVAEQPVEYGSNGEPTQQRLIEDLARAVAGSYPSGSVSAEAYAALLSQLIKASQDASEEDLRKAVKVFKAIVDDEEDSF